MVFLIFFRYIVTLPTKAIQPKWKEMDTTEIQLWLHTIKQHDDKEFIVLATIAQTMAEFDNEKAEEIFEQIITNLPSRICV